jgi:hypothetical protein
MKKYKNPSKADVAKDTAFKRAVKHNYSLGKTAHVVKNAPKQEKETQKILRKNRKIKRAVRGGKR